MNTLDTDQSWTLNSQGGCVIDYFISPTSLPRSMRKQARVYRSHIGWHELGPPPWGCRWRWGYAHRWHVDSSGWQLHSVRHSQHLRLGLSDLADGVVMQIDLRADRPL